MYFVFDSGATAMATHHSGGVGQCKQALADGGDELLTIATGQIAATNTAIEECVAAEAYVMGLGIETYTTGGRP